MCTTVSNFKSSAFGDFISSVTPDPFKKLGGAIARAFSALSHSLFSFCWKCRSVSMETSHLLSKSQAVFQKTFAYRERVDKRLCSQALLQEGPEVWAQKVIQHYQIEKGKNCYSTPIKLDLPIYVEVEGGRIAGHTYYVELQKQIADLKSGEDDSHKPSIDLKLIGKNTLPSRTSDFAIIGGLGPLADADLLDRTMRELEERGAELDHLKISLYSNPPPRKRRDLPNLPLFLRRVIKFLYKPNIKFYIASNTGHLNFRGLNILGYGHGVHMVKRIAKDLQRDPNSHVLILGTTQAYKAKLYPNALTPLGVNHHSATPKEQEILQEEIDKQKHNTLEDGGERLFTTIQQMVTRIRKSGKPVDKILLGCTELPAILYPYLRRIEEELEVEIVDSQQEFAKIIAQDTLSIDQEEWELV